MANIVLSIFSILIINVILFGINGTLVLEPLLNYLVPLQSIISWYSALDSIFEFFPFFTSRSYSVGFVVLMSLPLLLFIIHWISNIIRYIILRSYILVKRERRKHESEAFTWDIELIVLNQDGKILIQPRSKRSIVVSKAVLEVLSDDELDAVLAHEVHHIQNRDLTVTAFATIFSLILGGKNALLAFYDYPKIEREADDYAAETVGVNFLISAIRKLENASAETHIKTADYISLGTPRFMEWLDVNRSKRNRTDRGIRDHLRISTIREELILYIVLPYRVFFGSVILDAAHLDTDERIERLVKERK